MYAQVIFSDHAIERCAQRNLAHEEVLYVMEYGRKEFNAGAVMYYLGKRNIPRHDRADQRIAQLEGTAVQAVWISGTELVILTVYRNKETALKHHRRKSKYRQNRPLECDTLELLMVDRPLV